MSFSLGNIVSTVAAAALPAVNDAAAPNPPPIKSDALGPQPPPITPNPLTDYVLPGGLHPAAAAATNGSGNDAAGYNLGVISSGEPRGEGGGFSGFLHTVASVMRSGGSPG